MSAACSPSFGHRTDDTQIALDPTAESFARALEHAASFHAGPQPPAAWLYAIARNLLTDSYRRRQVQDDARRRLGLEPMTVTDLGFERAEAVADAGTITGIRLPLTVAAADLMAPRDVSQEP